MCKGRLNTENALQSEEETEKLAVKNSEENASDNPAEFESSENESEVQD